MKSNYIYNPEKEVKHTTYWQHQGLFSPEECETIKEIGNSINQKEALTFGGSQENVRKGKVSWIPQGVSTEFIYDKIFKVAETANEAQWHFELTGFLEDCQFTTYDSNEEKGGDFYGYHLDIDGDNVSSKRKISVVVQLTDPEEYEGGDLEILTSDLGFSGPKQQGTALLFSSFLLHRVTPVTKGKRNSLVLWISGRPYK